MKKIIAIIAILIVMYLIIDFFKRNKSPINEKLMAYVAQKRDYKIYFGWPLKKPIKWVKMKKIVDNFFILDGLSEKITFDQRVKSFIVCYPSGELIDTENQFYPLPKGVYYMNYRTKQVEDYLTQNALENGKRYLSIYFNKSMIHPNDPNYFTTTLKNISSYKIKVIQFGGYIQDGDKWSLNNVSGDFYTEKQFREWYGLNTNTWILPKESVSDPNNYGAGLWAYYCQTETGEKFIAGKIVP